MYTTYDMFDDIFELRNMVDRFFTENPLRTGNIQYPYVNFYEKGDELQIKALVPGVDASSLNIQLVDNSLLIEGEKKSDIEDRHYIRRERNFGSFKKSIRLPFKADPDKINASLKDGILLMTLYKREDEKPKRIEIN